MYFGGLEPKAYIPIKDKKGNSRFILNRYLRGTTTPAYLIDYPGPTPGSNFKNIYFLVQFAVVLRKSRKAIGLVVKW